MYKLILLNNNTFPSNYISSTAELTQEWNGKTYSKIEETPLTCFDRFINILKFVGILLCGIIVIPIAFSSYRDRVKTTYKETGVSIEVTYAASPPSYGLTRKKVDGIWCKIWSSDLRCTPERDDDLTTITGVNTRAEGWKLRYKTALEKWKKEDLSTPLLGRIKFKLLPAHFGLWMGGIALVAAYEKARLGLDNLHVCETFEAMQVSIQSYLKQQGDFKAAFVVGTSGGWEDNPYNLPMHKITIGLERHEGQVKVVLFEPSGGASPINTSLITSSVSQELLVRNYKEHILKLLIDLDLGRNSSIYISAVPRERLFGCAIYALDDALAFLKRNDFLYLIQNRCTKTTEVREIPLYSINDLPPEFMIGTQSCTQLETYAKDHPSEVLKPLPGKKAHKTFNYYSKKYWKQTADGKWQNHYIAHVWNRQMEIVLRALERFTSAELKEALATTLVSVPGSRPPVVT